MGSNSQLPDNRLTPGIPDQVKWLEFNGVLGSAHAHLQFQDQGGVWRDYQGTYSTVAQPPSLTFGSTDRHSAASDTDNNDLDNTIKPLPANTSFNSFNFVGLWSYEQEDPRGGINPYLFQGSSTYNYTVRPKVPPPAPGAYTSGATADFSALGAYLSYNSQIPTANPK